MYFLAENIESIDSSLTVVPKQSRNSEYKLFIFLFLETSHDKCSIQFVLSKHFCFHSAFDQHDSSKSIFKEQNCSYKIRAQGPSVFMSTDTLKRHFSSIRYCRGFDHRPKQKYFSSKIGIKRAFEFSNIPLSRNMAAVS